MHTVLPSPSAQSGVPYLRKEVEVRDSGSRHHPRGKREHFQSRVVLTLAQAAWSPKRRVVPKRDAKWLPPLGLNPSANLPLQPHFRLLPQLATAASIPGRCGPVVWSQLSPSSSGPHYKSLFGSPLLAAPCYITSSYLSGPIEKFSLVALWREQMQFPSHRM